MRRVLFHLVMFVVLGAIVNVAVAWACAFWSSVEGESVRGSTINERSQVWFLARREGFGVTHLTSRHISYRDGAVDVLERKAADIAPDWARSRTERSHQHGRVLFAAGWPVRTLQCWYDLDTDEQPPQPRGGLSLPKRSAPGLFVWRPELPALPYEPIWSGLVVGTALYASGLFLLCVIPMAIRRQVRYWRGRCPACAYPIGTSEVCTECGGPVRPQRADVLVRQ